MDIYSAAEIVLRILHEDLEGKMDWAVFLNQRTRGYDDAKSKEVRGVYSKALIILLDEGLCSRLPNSDIVRLAKKGIDANGDFRKYLKKAKTITFLEKVRRVAPIISMIVVIITFILTFIIKKNADKKAAARQKAAATTAPVKPTVKAKEIKK